jgi:hypothetical protein
MISRRRKGVHERDVIIVEEKRRKKKKKKKTVDKSCTYQ